MKKPNTQPPVLAELVLGELDERDGADLVAGQLRESERFTGLDLDARGLRGIRFSECELVGVSLNDVDLRDTRFVDTRVSRLNAAVLRAASSSWRSSLLEGSRIGSAELQESSWQSVHIRGCKLGFLNLRNAELADVRITDCTIDELDLGGAKVTRLAFEETALGCLDVERATLSHCDLRGADIGALRGIDSLRGVTVSGLQLIGLAPLLAAHLGIEVER